VSARRASPGGIFHGRNGLRAGWGLLIFGVVFMLFTALLSLLAIGMGKPPDRGEMPLRFVAAGEAVTVFATLTATALMTLIEGRSFGAYYLSARHLLGNVALGLATGFAFLSALVGILLAGGYLVFDGVAQHGAAAGYYAAALLLACFLVAVFEEMFFRGYPLASLARGVGFWPAAVVTSSIFAASHWFNDGETALGIAGVFAAGMLLCLLVRLSGALWLGIGFHTAWDWAQSYLYGVPDSGTMIEGHLLISHAMGDTRFSGGTVGPEGSVFAMPVLVAGLVVLSWAYRKTGLAGR